MVSMRCDNMVTEKEVDDVVKKVYLVYGSSSGGLFGISSSHRGAIRGIIKAVLIHLGGK